MKRAIFAALGLVLMLGGASHSVAADAPWNGTWKLRQSKDLSTRPTITVTQSQDGMYHWPGGLNYACDGKEYPMPQSGVTITCTGSDAEGYDETTKVNGKLWRKIHDKFSDNGQLLVENFSTTNSDGSTSTEIDTLQRLSGSHGLVGEWKFIKIESPDSPTMTISFSNNSIRVEGSYDAKLDGAPVPVSGMPQGFTIAFKQENPTKLRYDFKLNGSTVLQGVWTLGSDGTVLTEEKWKPGNETDKQVLIYDKQS